MDLMPLEETSLKGWIFSGSKDGILCYSEGIDTVWDVNARNIAPAFLINTGYSVEEEKEMRSSKTGNEAVDGQIALNTVLTTKRNDLAQIVCRKVIGRARTHIQSFDTEIDRIGSPLDSRHQ